MRPAGSVRRAAGRLALGSLLLGGVACTDASEPADTSTLPAAQPTRATATSTPGTTPGPDATSGPSASPDSAARTTTSSTTTDPSPSTRPPPEAAPPFDAQAAIRTVRILAGRIGPREASSSAYQVAADWVQGRLRSYGYDVRRQRVPVPAGNSWGVDVPAGVTTNLVATTPGFDPAEPHVIVGAHLDTVPQAPGAEDNASGVAVLLELARLASGGDPRLPVVFVAFGGEEPRGDGDDLHHFGSRAMVDKLRPDQRRGLVAMVSLDRVGVGSVVPVSSGGQEAPTVRGALVRAASRAGVDVQTGENQSSDHWSFDKAGYPAARIGSTPYAAYHSASDLPPVVSQAQLARVGAVMSEWLDL